MTTWTNATEQSTDNWDQRWHGSYAGRSYVAQGYVNETDDDTTWGNATEASPSWSNATEASPSWTNATEASTTWTNQ